MVSLLGVTWWQLPLVLSWSLTQLLQQQGLTDVEVEVSDVGVSQALIKHIDISYMEPDTKLQIQLKQVRLEYSLSELIKGRVESLLINSMLLKLDHQPSSKVSASPTLPNIELLLAAFKAVDPSAFPVNAVELANISLSHNLASELVSSFDTIELQARLSKQRDQLTAKLLFANQQSLHWANDVKNGWNIHFFDTPIQQSQPQTAQQHQAILSVTLSQVAQSLVFGAQIRPTLTSSLPIVTKLHDNAIDINEVTVAGTIKAGQAGTGLALLSAVQASGLRYQDNAIQALSGQFDIQLAQVSVKSQQAPWRLEVKFDNTVSFANTNIDEWQAGRVQINANGSLSVTENAATIISSDLLLTIDKLQQENELELSETSFSGTTSINIDSENWSFDFIEPWELKSQYARFDETELPQGLSIRSAQPTRVKGAFISSLDPVSEQQQSKIKNDVAEIKLVEKILLDVEVPELRSISQRLSVHAINAALQINQAKLYQGQLYANGSLAIPQLVAVDYSSETVLKPQANNSEKGITNWRLDNFYQSFELDNQVFTSRGSMSNIERDLHIESTSKHDFKQQRGETDFRFNSIDFNDPQRLNHLLSPLLLNASLVTGEIELAGKASWTRDHEQWQTTVDIDSQLINLGGAYEDTYFSGINAKSSLQVYPQILSRKPLWLTIDNVDVGVVNTDVVVEFTVRPSGLGEFPSIELLRAQTQLLKGRMSLKPNTYDLNRAQHRLQVLMQNIDLNELVRVQQLDDIQATGLVTGELPIMIENGQVSIDNGQLQAVAPGGTLRYQADNDTIRENKYAETVMLALKNFNYDALRADTYYKPDGTLLLQLRLQGNNPDFEQGRQVNLNINLEQNVLKLFESLRLIEGVSGTLDKRVQDFYKKTTSQ